MNKNRCASTIIVGFMLLASGCQSMQLSDNNVSGDETSTVITTAAETKPNAPEIEAVDCKGADYTILSREVSGYTFPYNEFFAEEQNGDTMNDAVYARNTAIEEKYNLKLVSITDSSVANLAKNSILAGDDVYDLIMPMISDAFSLALQGMFQEISSVAHVDLIKPWWMKSIAENTSVAGKNYFISGDLNLSVLNGVGVTYFNKDLAANQSIDDIYQTVRDGNWTIDMFMKYCKGITRDVDGDTVLNGNDMFGLTCNAFCWQPLFYGSGSMIIEKDAGDIPMLAWGSEKNINIMTKIIGFLNDKDSTILVNQYPELQDAGGWGNASIKMFTEDRALFWIEIIYGVLQLRDMDTDFGILPMPKYDENQEEYASYIHANCVSTACVPVTNKNLDLAGRILEDMAYQSYITVRPAYYETTLKGKVSRDDESGEMLDIIYKNINLDLTLAMNMSGLPIDNTMRSAMIGNSTDLASMIAEKKSACEEIIKKNTEAILGLSE